MWNRPVKLMIIGLAAAFTLLAASDTYAQSENRVLVLHSYGLDFKWTLDLDAAIREVLEHDPESTTTVHSEVLDAKYHGNSAYMEDLASFLERKYRTWSFDVIIATDNYALDFVKYARERLWPSVPLVFAGINDYSPELVAGMEKTTGVAEELSVERTIEEIRRLFPNRKRLLILSDRTATSDRNVSLVLGALAGYKLAATVHHPVTIESLERIETEFGRDTIALLVGLVRNEAGTPLDFHRSGMHVSRTLDVPVFSLWDFYMGTGIAGGYMTSGWQQGLYAARLARRILDGEDPDEIAVVEESPNLPVFDLEALGPFGIEEDDLPPESIVYNRPEGLWEKYQVEILLAISAFLLLFSIALLSYEVARRRGVTARATAESLREKETLLREIHHRVKNNLQVVSSMLSIQSSLIDDEKSLEYFQDARTRIQSMALVHEHLYESPSLARIDLRSYMDDLVATVARSMDVSQGGATVSTSVDEVGIDLDHAIPLGMVVNELLSNALKYAYGDDGGEVTISLDYTNGRVKLEVADNGAGMPAEDPGYHRSLGLQLVTGLAEQLGGTVRFEDNEPGLRVRFEFPLP
ncbi:MAG: ABC transporter substrate binding protein [Spirochaetia bacterium]